MTTDRITPEAFKNALALAEIRLAVQEHCQRWHHLDPQRRDDYSGFMYQTGQAMYQLYPIRDHNSVDQIKNLPDILRDTAKTLFDLDADELPNVWGRLITDRQIIDFREAANEIRHRHFEQHDAKLILYAHTLKSVLEDRASSVRQQGYILAGLSFLCGANFFDTPFLISCLAAATAYSARTVAATHQAFEDPKPLATKVWELVNNPESLAPHRRQLAAAAQWSFGKIEGAMKAPDNTHRLIRYLEELPGYQQKNPCRTVFSTAPTPK